MTYLDAAYTILKAAGQPLRFKEITQRALVQELKRRAHRPRSPSDPIRR
jgi:hypothetical protein